MINSFIIEIKNGKICFKSDHHQNLYESYLDQFQDGKYRLEINEMKEKRSEQQNRYMWVYLREISRESGHTEKELHALFRGMFLTEEVKEVMGKPVRITKSTTDLSTGEFCNYLAEIYNYTEIPLPDTQEYLGYSYHK